MKPGLPYELMQNWTPQQLLAVYDFCRLMSEGIWQQHEDTLLQLMIELDRDTESEPLDNNTGDNLELPFDDVNSF